MDRMLEKNENNKIFHILLLTNRDSDNAGDQVIEECDISLISTVMKNLNIGADQYVINSRAAGIISKKYMETEDPKLLQDAEFTIQNSDLIIFGGAPLFNFLYQPFYERTAVTLEIAEKYQKPVIFSAIGVEGYDEYNEKCQRLKKTLNFDCVKQITTRDDFESLKKYIENENISIRKVADPAVFTSKIFENFIAVKDENSKEKVGIFVLRSNGFLDNGVNLSRDDAAELWKAVIAELEKRNYDYELLTSGHFGDEAFLDYLIRKYNVKAEKCIFNINTPEKLINKISSYSAVISCRLHPGIISYSLGVPAVGLVWNYKVKHFYESIGYAERVIDVNHVTPEKIVDKIEAAIPQGVKKDSEYLVSVYDSLFNGIKKALCPGKENVVPYNYDELMKEIPAFQGTSEKEQEEKLKRKFRRTYGKYNELFDKNTEQRLTIREMQGYIVIYNGGMKTDKLSWNYDNSRGEVQKLDTGSVEYKLNKFGINDGSTLLVKNGFSHPEYNFIGWQMRVKDDRNWYWYLEDGTIKSQEDYKKGIDKDKYILKDETKIPYIPLKGVATIVLEGVWKAKFKTRVVRKLRKIRGQK